MHTDTVLVLGPNGNVGHAAAKAFVAAGWRVTLFGRSSRHEVPGATFVTGDAADPAALAAAMADNAVVFNGLNLRYDKWGNGRIEAQLAAVIAAMGPVGRTLLHPGNVYNYAASQRVIDVDSPQNPERPRGDMRKRMDSMLADAARNGAIRVILLRAGDFFEPGQTGAWFDQLILRDAGKGKVALAAHDLPHSWAYLPDLAEAFVRLAGQRETFTAFERFHFRGHFVTAAQIFALSQKIAGRPLKRVATPWALLSVVGLFDPVMRELVKMRYLWDNPMELRDPRLAALLGPDFGTPFETAFGNTIAPYFTAARRAA